MEQVYNEKRDCCGCTACFNGCPVGAITMEEDDEGFYYPLINQDKCIDCHWCQAVCPFINSEELKEEKGKELYLGIHKDENILKDSTSGGAFTGISDLILDDGGFVYGAVFDEDFKVVHVEASSKDKRNEMRKSKYSQSFLDEIFKSVRDHLTKNEKVLFTGSPCQVAGLKGYLNQLKWDENLYTVDLICHSIPSPKIFSSYLDYLEKKEDGKLEKIAFRTKDIPWSRNNSNRGFTYKIEGSDEIKKDDFFYKMFFHWKTIMRPSCERCPFTDINRVGDITIGDFWGIEKYDENLYDERGVSSIMVNSEKGKELVERLSEKIKINKRSLSESIENQNRLKEPVKYPDSRDEFWEDFHNLGLQTIIEKNKKY